MFNLLEANSNTAIPGNEVSVRLLEVNSCPMCGSGNSSKYFGSKDLLHKTPGYFEYKRCLACRTVYQAPRVMTDDLAKCYPAQYYTHQEMNNKPVIAKDSEAQKKTEGKNDLSIYGRLCEAVRNELLGRPNQSKFRPMAKALSRIPQMRVRAFKGFVRDELLPVWAESKMALDVGCGAGGQMINLSRVGWQVEGVEWDPLAAEVARKKTGFQIHNGDFRQLSLPSNRYGLIYLHHVFEHFDEPREVFKEINRLLVKGGRVILTYPNPESLGAKVYGQFWYPWEIPRHLVLPPARSVVRVAAEFGMSALKAYTSTTYALEWLSHSSDYKAGRSIKEFYPNVKLSDRFWYWCERLLVLLGCKIGEELTVVLVKDA